MSQPPEKDKNSKRESIWPPILFVCGLFAVLYVAQLFEDSSSGAGRKFFVWFMGIGALLIFFNIIWGPSLRETMANLKGVSKAILGVLLALLVIGGISQCTGGSGTEGNGLGGVPDNIRR